MGMVKAICTQCGGKLDVDSTKEAAVCPFCGTPFIVEKAINNYNHSITNNISANEVVVFKDDRYEHLYNRLKYFADNNDKIENHSELEKTLYEIKKEYPYKNDELFDVVAELIEKNRVDDPKIIEKRRVEAVIEQAYSIVNKMTNQFNPHVYIDWLDHSYSDGDGYYRFYYKIDNEKEFFDLKKYPYSDIVKKVENVDVDAFLAQKRDLSSSSIKYIFAIVLKKTKHGTELKRYLKEYDIWYKNDLEKHLAAQEKERKEKRKEDLLVVSGVLFSIVLMILFLWGCCRFLVWIW